ncbi:MAG: hypothetical protein LBJ64_06115 [Deltaproteobacteria bacterium]|jgi:hypothetical protein|nr:hypothetical protein [Deltaproteobacteria bacterium]
MAALRRTKKKLRVGLTIFLFLLPSFHAHKSLSSHRENSFGMQKIVSRQDLSSERLAKFSLSKEELRRAKRSIILPYDSLRENRSGEVKFSKNSNVATARNVPRNPLALKKLSSVSGNIWRKPAATLQPLLLNSPPCGQARILEPAKKL